MTTTIEYSSADSGAPSLAGDSSSRLDVLLHACLVTGYGSKAAAGWTRPFSATGKAVFRNALAAGATGHMFRVADLGTDTLGYRVATLQGYVSMSDVDTPVGSDLIPNASWHANGGRILKKDALSSTPVNWYVWADELTCWGWIEAGTPRNRLMFGFGDFESYIPGDAYNSFVFHCGASMSATTTDCRLGEGCAAGFASPTTTSTDRGLSLMRAQDGMSAGAQAAAFATFAPNANPGTNQGGGRGAPITSAVAPGSLQRYFHPVLIASQGELRGRLRGLHYLLNDCRTVTSGTVESDASGTALGSEIRLMHVNQGAQGNDTNVTVIGVEKALEW